MGQVLVRMEVGVGRETNSVGRWDRDFRVGGRIAGAVRR
jgi:hypothetical protein